MQLIFFCSALVSWLRNRFVEIIYQFDDAVEDADDDELTLVG